MRVFAASLALLLGLTLAVHAQQQSARPPRPAPGPQTARPRAEAAVPFKAGETLTYDVSWGRFLVAATATLRVNEKRASYGSIAYAISAEGRPIPLVARLYPLFYKMDSLVDSYSMAAQWSSLYTETGSRKRLASTRFDRNTHQAHYEIADEPASKLDFAIPTATQDGLTMMYALRTRAFRAGDSYTVPVADDGSMYTATFTTSGQERITVPFGTFDTWKVPVKITDAAGKPVGGNIVIWFTTDVRRLPAKIEAELPVGTFAIALRQAN